jgi:hypothetical protein
MRHIPAANWIYAGALACAHCAAQTAVQIVTDRPDVTESSIVVPLGSIQMENGITWAQDHGASVLDASETLLRLGVWTRTELRLSAPGYVYRVDGQHTVSGFGDGSIGLKEQLGPLPGAIELAVILAISVPTGAKTLSSHGLDPLLKLPWSRELEHGWSMGGMQSIFYNTDHRHRELTGESTLYLEREIAKHADLFTEYVADYSGAVAARQEIHFGTAYRITTRQQADFHFGFGLSHGAPRQFFAAGYSFRIDHLFGKSSR